jgi:hypothetical protein
MNSRCIALSLASLLTFTACDYEWKDEPPPLVIPNAEEQEVALSQDQGKKQEPPKPKSDARPVLAPGTAYAGSSKIPDKAKRLEILNLVATNEATISSNTQENELNNVFDGADDSLLRSPEINPVDVTVTFKTPKKFRAIRVRSTYSDFAVAVQIDNGERLILDPIPDGDWALMVWPQGVTAKRLFVQTLRRSRDNFVHLNEIEVLE